MKSTTSAKKRTAGTKRGGKGSRPKPTRRSRLSRRQLLTTGAVVAGLFLIFALLLYSNPGVVRGIKRTARRTIGSNTVSSKEIASNAVYGKVIGINIGSTPRGTIKVESLRTGRVYTFYVGWRTDYHPSRYPYRGEKVKVYYVYDRGFLKATRLYIKR